MTQDRVRQTTARAYAITQDRLRHTAARAYTMTQDRLRQTTAWAYTLNQNQNQNLCLFDPHLHQCSITMYIMINLVCGSGDHC